MNDTNQAILVKRLEMEIWTDIIGTRTPVNEMEDAFLDENIALITDQKMRGILLHEDNNAAWGLAEEWLVVLKKEQQKRINKTEDSND